tara:strand:+ start:218 stop:400 length:183 start_codon:yes stop_codon:yes gene_type:complete
MTESRATCSWDSPPFKTRWYLTVLPEHVVVPSKIGIEGMPTLDDPKSPVLGFGPKLAAMK